MESTTCFICGITATSTDPLSQDSVHFSCNRCGKYAIDWATHRRPPPISLELAPFLGAYTRQSSSQNRPPVLGRDLAQMAEPHAKSSFGERSEKLLRYIGLQCKRPGPEITLDSGMDYTVCDAQDSSELDFYMNSLASSALIKRRGSNKKYFVQPTMLGWVRLHPTLGREAIPNTAFVACAFQEDIAEAYSNAIEPALRACGYTVRCMLDIPTNEGITDRILSEIRQSEIMVADFTYHKGGVYFESGFAKGLGRPVIWSCRKDQWEGTHFDIKPPRPRTLGDPRGTSNKADGFDPGKHHSSDMNLVATLVATPMETGGFSGRFETNNPHNE